MWQVIKPYGYNQTVQLVNTEEDKTITLGRVSIKMLDILKEDGGFSDLDYRDAWNFDVEKGIAQSLVMLVTIAEKPIRAKVDKKAKAKEVNKSVDAMDVLLGLANYS